MTPAKTPAMQSADRSTTASDVTTAGVATAYVATAHVTTANVTTAHITTANVTTALAVARTDRAALGYHPSPMQAKADIDPTMTTASAIMKPVAR